MEITWLCCLTFLLAVWAVLDGYTLGTGIIYLRISHTESERKQVLHTVEPLWEGDEVWLVAFGGALVFSFPGLYASAFSGFYLALFVLLWLLVLRGVAIELRNHLDHRFWHVFWDWGFALSSMFLVYFFGVALGAVLRGVSADPAGYFFLPLWVDLSLGPRPAVFDWYTALIGLQVFFAVMLHGCLWVAFRTDGPAHERSLSAARRTWPLVVVLTVINAALTFAIQPQIPSNFQKHPWGVFFPLVAMAGLAAAAVFLWIRAAFLAFNAYAAYLFGMLASVVFGIFPYVLPPYRASNPDAGLTIYSTASGYYAQRIALAWFIPGMLAVSGYSAYAHLRNAGKVRVHEGEAQVSSIQEGNDEGSPL